MTKRTITAASLVLVAALLIRSRAHCRCRPSPHPSQSLILKRQSAVLKLAPYRARCLLRRRDGAQSTSRRLRQVLCQRRRQLASCVVDDRWHLYRLRRTRISNQGRNREIVRLVLQTVRRREDECKDRFADLPGTEYCNRRRQKRSPDRHDKNSGSAYSVVHVKTNGQWKMASVTERNLPDTQPRSRILNGSLGTG